MKTQDNNGIIRTRQKEKREDAQKAASYLFLFDLMIIFLFSYSIENLVYLI